MLGPRLWSSVVGRLGPSIAGAVPPLHGFGISRFTLVLVRSRLRLRLRFLCRSLSLERVRRFTRLPLRERGRSRLADLFRSREPGRRTVFRSLLRLRSESRLSCFRSTMRAASGGSPPASLLTAGPVSLMLPPTELEDGPATAFLSCSLTDAGFSTVLESEVAVDISLPGSGRFCSCRFISLRCLKDRTPCMMVRPAVKKQKISFTYRHRLIDIPLTK